MTDMCCIANCVSKREYFHHFQFPSAAGRRLRWLETIDDDELSCLNVEELDKLYVCKKHFEKKSFIRHNQLAETANPTLFSHEEIWSGEPSTKLDGSGQINVDHGYSHSSNMNGDHTYCKKVPKDPQKVPETKLQSSGSPSTHSAMHVNNSLPTCKVEGKLLITPNPKDEEKLLKNLAASKNHQNNDFKESYLYTPMHEIYPDATAVVNQIQGKSLVLDPTIIASSNNAAVNGNPGKSVVLGVSVVPSNSVIGDKEKSLVVGPASSHFMSRNNRQDQFGGLRTYPVKHATVKSKFGAPSVGRIYSMKDGQNQGKSIGDVPSHPARIRANQEISIRGPSSRPLYSAGVNQKQESVEDSLDSLQMGSSKATQGKLLLELLEGPSSNSQVSKISIDSGKVLGQLQDDQNKTQSESKFRYSTTLSSSKRICIKELNPQAVEIYKELVKAKNRCNSLKAKMRRQRAMRPKINQKFCFEKLTRKMNPITKSLLWMQIQHSKSTNRGRRFSDEEKSLALTIYNLNPQCFRILEKILIMPHRSTVKKWKALKKSEEEAQNNTQPMDVVKEEIVYTEEPIEMSETVFAELDQAVESICPDNEENVNPSKTETSATLPENVPSKPENSPMPEAEPLKELLREILKNLPPPPKKYKKPPAKEQKRSIENTLEAVPHNDNVTLITDGQKVVKRRRRKKPPIGTEPSIPVIHGTWEGSPPKDNRFSVPDIQIVKKIRRKKILGPLEKRRPAITSVSTWEGGGDNGNVQSYLQTQATKGQDSSNILQTELPVLVTWADGSPTFSTFAMPTAETLVEVEHPRKKVKKSIKRIKTGLPSLDTQKDSSSDYVEHETCSTKLVQQYAESYIKKETGSPSPDSWEDGLPSGYETQAPETYSLKLLQRCSEKRPYRNVESRSTVHGTWEDGPPSNNAASMPEIFPLPHTLRRSSIKPSNRVNYTFVEQVKKGKYL